MTVVKHSISDDIALIEISNPPVNAISAAVRIELLQTIETLALEMKPYSAFARLRIVAQPRK